MKTPHLYHSELSEHIKTELYHLTMNEFPTEEVHTTSWKYCILNVVCNSYQKSEVHHKQLVRISIHTEIIGK